MTDVHKRLRKAGNAVTSSSDVFFLAAAALGALTRLLYAVCHVYFTFHISLLQPRAGWARRAHGPMRMAPGQARPAMMRTAFLAEALELALLLPSTHAALEEECRVGAHPARASAACLEHPAVADSPLCTCACMQALLNFFEQSSKA